MSSKLSASEALKHLKNVSKKRLYELMNSGELSYISEGLGNKKIRKIEASELIRVFGDSFNVNGTGETEETAQKPVETGETDKKQDNEVSFIRIENQFLHDKIKLLEDSLKQAQKREEDLSAKLDKAQETLHSQTYLLKDMREQDSHKESNKGFFRKIFN